MPHITARDGTRLYAEEAGSGSAVVFVHEYAGDYRTWEPQMRYFSRAHRCVTYSQRGYPPSDVPSEAERYGQTIARDDVLALMDALKIDRAHIVGHSMGSLIALEAAARHPDKVTALALIGTAAAMPVSRDLLAAAEANDHAAVDMVSIWGNGFQAGLGGALVPGAWMVGATMRLLERAKPGVLFKDLAACNVYDGGIAAAARPRAAAASATTSPHAAVSGEAGRRDPAAGSSPSVASSGEDGLRAS